jgi:hypothetical protein
MHELPEVTRRNSTARNKVSVSTEITVIRPLGSPGQVKARRLAKNTMCGPNSKMTMNIPM